MAVVGVHLSMTQRVCMAKVLHIDADGHCIDVLIFLNEEHFFCSAAALEVCGFVHVKPDP
jgi:hypothetical protein